MKRDVAGPAQQETFEAQTTWFHVFRSMIDAGDMAKLPGSALKVYLVVKSYTNFSTGLAFPSRELIAEKAGLSEAQVKRSLQTLEEFGYLTRAKAGRNNVYTLREKVEIQDEAGRPAAVATWDYLPSSVRDAVADLKNVLVTGDFEGAKIVHIERLQVNIMHLHDQASNTNVQTQNVLGGLDSLPDDLKERVLKAMAAQQKSRDI